MKKIIASVCAALSVAACAAAFAACGDEEEDGYKKVTVSEKTDVAALVSQKMTEDTWNSALGAGAFHNVTYSLKAGEQNSMRIFYADDKRKIETTAEGDATTAFFNREGSKYYCYPLADGDGYTKREIEASEWEAYTMGSERVQSWISSVKFSGAVWNEAQKGYDVSYVLNDTSVTFVVKFVEGKLAAFYVAGNASSYAVYYNYGKTTVALPDITIPGPGGVDVIDETTDPAQIVSEELTAEEWAAAFDETEFSNAVFYCDLGLAGFTRVTYDANKIKVESNAGGRALVEYLEKDGEDYYEYIQNEGGYRKEQITASEWNNRTLPRYMISWMPAAYPSAEWSDEDKGYVYTNGSSAAVIKFADGKLAAFYTPGAGMKAIVYGYGEASVTLPSVKQIVDENTDPDTIVSEQVTDKEWEAAFAKASFGNVTMYMSDSAKEDDKTPEEQIFRIVTADDKTKFSYESNQSSVVNYAQKTGSKYYSYTYTEGLLGGKGSWIKNETDESTYEGWTVYYLIGTFAEMMGPRVWNGQDGYTCETKGAGGVALTVKLIDKKIAAIYAKGVRDGVTYNTTILLYGYGESVVELPNADGSYDKDPKPAEVSGDTYAIAGLYYDRDYLEGISSEEELEMLAVELEKLEKRFAGKKITFLASGILGVDNALADYDGSWRQGSGFVTVELKNRDGVEQWTINEDGTITMPFSEHVYATLVWQSPDSGTVGGGDVPSHNHTDKDGDGYCDECKEELNYDVNVPSHNHTDKDGDGYCDECKEELNYDVNVPSHSHIDKDGDGYCDECGAG